MAYLFTILFLAAVIGIFRPYRFIQGSKRTHYGIAAFVLFVLIGVTAPKTTTGDVAGDTKAESAVAGESARPRPQKAEPPEESSKWAYSSSKDEMRGSESRYAELSSENSVDLDFPYGQQAGKLTVRKDPQYGLDVMFSVASGQILCHGFGDSYINAKFDDGPVRRFNCNGASDGRSEVGFIDDAKRFLGSLKTAKRTVVEAEFFQNGRQQFVFDSQNLKWE